jgi:hypothetical protein
MDRVQKRRNSEFYTQSSEPVIINIKICLLPDLLEFVT